MKFTNFIRLVFSTIAPDSRYSNNWHIRVIADRLQAALAGNITRLIINAPPRTLKSTCVSVAWPAWILGQNPSARIIVASYSQIISEKMSLETRYILQSPWFKEIFPEVDISKEQNTKRKLQTTKLGYRFATSVGGSLTGDGGNFLILDDPMNPLQAESSKYRSRVIDWFGQSFMTRLNDRRKGVVVLVMHRLHSEDLTGHLINKGMGNRWHTLSIPYIAEKTTVFYSSLKRVYKKSRKVLYIRRKEETLKRQISQRHIAQLKQEVGSYVFASQYQQNPIISPICGLVKHCWFQRYKEEERRHFSASYVIQSWDTSSTARTGSNFSVCTTWAIEGKNIFLLSVHREKLKYVALKNLVQNLYTKWKPGIVLIEEKASGHQLVQELECLFPILPCNPGESKLSRLMKCIPIIQAGYIFLPQYAAWLHDFEHEVCSFPYSTYDDQVDSMTQAVLWAQETLCSRVRIREL